MLTSAAVSVPALAAVTKARGRISADAFTLKVFLFCIYRALSVAPEPYIANGFFFGLGFCAGGTAGRRATVPLQPGSL